MRDTPASRPSAPPSDPRATRCTTADGKPAVPDQLVDEVCGTGFYHLEMLDDDMAFLQLGERVFAAFVLEGKLCVRYQEYRAPAPRSGDGKSQVRRNAEQDPTYSPYCLRCRSMERLQIVEPFFWRCEFCNAEHDERIPGRSGDGDPPPPDGLLAVLTADIVTLDRCSYLEGKSEGRMALRAEYVEARIKARERVNATLAALASQRRSRPSGGGGSEARH